MNEIVAFHFFGEPRGVTVGLRCSEADFSPVCTLKKLLLVSITSQTRRPPQPCEDDDEED